MFSANFELNIGLPKNYGNPGRREVFSLGNPGRRGDLVIQEIQVEGGLKNDLFVEGVGRGGLFLEQPKI